MKKLTQIKGYWFAPCYPIPYNNLAMFMENNELQYRKRREDLDDDTGIVYHDGAWYTMAELYEHGALPMSEPDPMSEGI